MNRIALTLAALLLTTAASPPSTTYIIATMPSAFGLSPVSKPTVQTGPVLGFTAAPMPNSDTTAPIAQDSAPGQTKVSPSLFTTRTTYRGEGYVPGSSAQADQVKNYRPVPGINLSVPLQ